jgi:hypothetical protein
MPSKLQILLTILDVKTKPYLPLPTQDSVMSLAPRFALPQISRRITTIRPRQLAASSNIAAEHKSRDGNTNARSRTSRPTPLLARPRTMLQMRPFSATPTRPRDHHFDTLKFVQRLKDEGFTEEQAEAMMKVLSDVIEER